MPISDYLKGLNTTEQNFCLQGISFFCKGSLQLIKGWIRRKNQEKRFL